MQAETSSLRELGIDREVMDQPSDVSEVWGNEARARSGAVDTRLGEARKRSDAIPSRVAKKAINEVPVNRSDEAVARPS